MTNLNTETIISNTGSNTGSARSVGAVRALTTALAAGVLMMGVAACSGDSDGDGGSADGGGASDESWCDVVDASNEIDAEFEAVATDPDALKGVIDQMLQLSDRFRAAAPDEIQSEVEQLADANTALAQVVVDADYRLEDVDNAELGAIVEPMLGASETIDVYTQDECGTILGPDDT